MRLTYSLTYVRTYLLTYVSTYSLTYVLTYLRTYALTYSLTDLGHLGDAPLVPPVPRPHHDAVRARQRPSPSPPGNPNDLLMYLCTSSYVLTYVLLMHGPSPSPPAVAHHALRRAQA